MDPITMAMLISGGLGVGAEAVSLLSPGGKELSPDFWKKYYSPMRVHMATEPARREFTAQEIAGGERWGGRGLETSEGAKKESLARESALGDVLAKAGAQEVDRASQYGINEWIRDYEEKQAQKDRWSKLAGQLLSIPTMYYGSKAFGSGLGEGVGTGLATFKKWGEGGGEEIKGLPDQGISEEELMEILEKLGLSGGANA